MSWGRAALAGIIAATAWSCVLADSSPAAERHAIVASVDGVPISWERYQVYEDAFLAPEGTLTVPREDVLVAVITQVLVERDADRRGLVVSPEAVEAAARSAQEVDVLRDSFAREGSDAGFRERIRLFLLYRMVKEEVVGLVEADPAKLRAAYDADPQMHVLSFDEALPKLRERVVAEEADRRWSEWLEEQRRCADIVIADDSFSVPSTTPLPSCFVPEP